MLEKYEDQQGTGEPEWQAEHTDEAYTFVTDQVAPGGGEIISEHWVSRVRMLYRGLSFGVRF